MKKALLILLVLFVAFGLTAKGGNEEAGAEAPVMEKGPYEDGIYFAAEEEFAGSGWKYVATLEVEDGYIVSADWNGVNIKAGEDKKTVSKAGKYPMVAFGGAQSDWHVQAEAAEAFLLETQDPTAINYTDEKGHTDDLAGVSIHVIEFFSLAEKALAAGPVGRGPYADGYYYAEEPVFNERTGWKYFVDMTVINGNIAAVNWNGVNVKAGEVKKTVSKSGNYNMVMFGGAQSEWDVQAEAAEAYLLETQDPTAISYKDDNGHTDDIAGVSIHVIEFFDLAEEALTAGPTMAGPYGDGTYHAEEPEFSGSGWKYFADLTVYNGRIVAANWNGVHKDAGEDKKTVSKAGKYPMVAFGGAQSDWHVQAAATEAAFLASQDPTAIAYKDEKGHTDDIAGVSIHVIEFYSLAEEALAAGPVEVGPYADGHYHAEEPQFNERTGWKYMVDMTVVNGRVIAANWNGAHVNSGTDKKTRSMDGQYPMVAAGGAQSDWHVQATATEAAFLASQDPTAITYKDDQGHTDDIAGVSIHVVEFYSLAEEALAAGPVEVGPLTNGLYEAEGEFSDNGWKSKVSITVIGGNIEAVYFDAVNEAGESKNALAAEGQYGMKENGGAMDSWDVQARRAADYLLEMGASAPVDDIAGVSIHIDEFFTLAAEALGL